MYVVSDSRGPRQRNNTITQGTDPSDAELSRCNILLLSDSFQTVDDDQVMLKVLGVNDIHLEVMILS